MSYQRMEATGGRVKSMGPSGFSLTTMCKNFKVVNRTNPPTSVSNCGVYSDNFGFILFGSVSSAIMLHVEF